MNATSIKEVTAKLETLSDNYLNEVINYLDHFEIGNHFNLSDNQISILEQRSNSPSSEFISAEESLLRIKTKYGI
jgi:hypothetical protein